MKVVYINFVTFYRISLKCFLTVKIILHEIYAYISCH